MSSSSPPQIKIARRTIEVPFFRERLSDTIAIEMMQIPAGEFEMGSPDNELERSNTEGPQHRVNVPEFFMGKYPVTQAQWRVVAGFPQIDRELKTDPSNFKGENRPVEQVSWHDAIEFCQRLSAYTQRAYRLPSEAEWEYACRAGTTTPFHFGATITTDLANYRGTDNETLNRSGSYGEGPKGEYRQQTTLVDQFGVANAFGLCDMHGNVLEWCLDPWHDNYEGAPTDGSVWLSENENQYHVLRGGSWFGCSWDCRSASRDRPDPGFWDDDYGLRVVCAVRVP